MDSSAPGTSGGRAGEFLQRDHEGRADGGDRHIDEEHRSPTRSGRSAVRQWPGRGSCPARQSLPRRRWPRATISAATERKNAAEADPAANTASSARRVGLHPTRSARLLPTSSSPPANAAVLSVDEKPQIPALQRARPGTAHEARGARAARLRLPSARHNRLVRSSEHRQGPLGGTLVLRLRCHGTASYETLLKNGPTAVNDGLWAAVNLPTRRQKL
jgi:hypothetical protein